MVLLVVVVVAAFIAVGVAALLRAAAVDLVVGDFFSRKGSGFCRNVQLYGCNRKSTIGEECYVLSLNVIITLLTMYESLSRVIMY